MSENEVFEKFVQLVKNHENAGGKFEDLFDYDAVKKKYKLKRQYTLSEAALKQRREVAKKPRRVDANSLIICIDELITKLERFRNRLEKQVDVDCTR